MVPNETPYGETSILMTTTSTIDNEIRKDKEETHRQTLAAEGTDSGIIGKSTVPEHTTLHNYKSGHLLEFA